MSLIYLIIATRTLGAADYGVLILVNAYVVMIGGVVAFSGFHGVVRYGAIALEAGDHGGLARIIRTMTIVEVACGAAAIAIAALLAPLIGPRLGWSSGAVEAAIPYSLAVMGTMRATPQGVLQIARRFDLIGLHQAVMPAIRLIGALAIWLWGGGLIGFILVWLFAAIVEGVSMWWFALGAWRRMVGDEPLLGPWRGALREHDGFRSFILITNFDLTLRELAPNLAPLTVGWLLGPAAAGLLALAQRATALLQQPATLLAQASYAVLAEQAAKAEFTALRHTVWRSAVLAMLVAVPIVAIIALAGGGLLSAIGGKSFAGGAVLLVLIAMSRLTALGATPIAAGLTALGRPQRSMMVALVTNLGMYPLLPLLLYLAGIDGAGWHAFIQNGVALLAMIFFFLRDAGTRKR